MNVDRPLRLRKGRGAFLAALLLLIAWSGARAEDPLDRNGAMHLFGYGERASFNILRFPKWTHVLARYTQERALETAPCGAGPCYLQRWRTFLDGLRTRSEMEQLRAINAYINRVRFVPDDINYGQVDYWATPREFFARGGDCEDYAIAKYLSLRNIGWDMHRVRVVVTMHERRQVLHAVLAVISGGTVYVLDNLLPEVTDHRRLTYYRPIYSINDSAWWFHTRPGVAEKPTEQDIDLMARASCGDHNAASIALLVKLGYFVPTAGPPY
ncbi:MAG: transglutaminase-like cysteine peptidase [Rhodospirillaceae bacterium]|nr:transglutaminase-like cysteine peptidase [Rhodospirillaceae bacterium]